MDLFGTESNYVGILHTIVSVGYIHNIKVYVQRLQIYSNSQLFQKPLEEMADKPDYLLNKSEVRAIFNNFSPIHDVHLTMLNQFR